MSVKFYNDCQESVVPFLWLSRKPAVNPENRHVYALYRNTIHIPSEVVYGVLRISAGSYYKLYINGEYVGRGPVREAYPWYQYDEYDMKPYLLNGHNLIAVHVYHRGQQTYTENVGVMGLWTEGEIHTNDGNFMINVHMDGWKVKRDLSFVQDTPCWSQSIKGDILTTGWGPGPQEYRDMRLEIADWTHPEFDDSDWSKPVVQGVKLKFYKRMIPFMKETRMFPTSVMRTGEISEPHATQIEPSSLLESDQSFAETFRNYPILSTEKVQFHDAVAVTLGIKKTTRVQIPCYTAAYLQVDFGKQVCGYPFISFIKGCDGVIIDFAYSENILQKERPDASHDRTYTAGRLMLREGYQRHTAAFLIHSFQYMGMVMRNMGPETIELEIKDIGIDFVSYPIERKGKFWCDDPLYNRIYEVSEWTNRMCMQDFYVDCMRREQVQWAAEAFIQGDIAWYLYGDHQLLKQLLIMGTHYEGVNFPSFIPNSGLWDPDIKTYPLFYVQGACKYYLYTEDKETVYMTMSTSRDILLGYLQHLDEYGLYSPGTKRQFFDLPEIGFQNIPLMRADTYKSHLSTNCMLLLALRAMVWLEQELGVKEYEEIFRSASESLAAAINKHFWNAGQGYFECGFGGVDNYVTLAFSGDPVRSGLTDKVQRERMWNKLFLNDGSPADGIIDAGYVGSYYLFEGLFHSEAEHHWLVDAFLRRHYQSMLEHGATTFWESYTGNRNRSFGHATTAHFPYFASREILGIKPLKPGFKEFQLFPKTMHLGLVEGGISTLHGDIEVRIQINSENYFELDITVPPETFCHFIIPEQLDEETIKIKCSNRQIVNKEVFKSNHYIGIFNEAKGYKFAEGKITVKGRTQIADNRQGGRL